MNPNAGARQRTRPRSRALLFATAAVLSAGLLAACGSSDPSMGPDHTGHGSTMGKGSPSTQERPAKAPAKAEANAVDVAFATGMLPHHEQAIDMARGAQAKASDPRLKALATAITASQSAEAATLRSWLRAWGEPFSDPGASMDHAGHAGMDHMEGMVSSKDLAELEALRGPAYDRRWMELMIAHHEGALAMAQREVASGSSAKAKALAEAIVAAQTREIAQMRGWLATLPG